VHITKVAERITALVVLLNSLSPHKQYMSMFSFAGKCAPMTLMTAPPRTLPLLGFNSIISLFRKISNVAKVALYTLSSLLTAKDILAG
jgi:hypothetical protein